MGTEVTHEINRPRLHPWIELAVQGNLLGDGNGAGIEAACAGGMHSLVIDEVGRVRVLQLFWLKLPIKD